MSLVLPEKSLAMDKVHVSATSLEFVDEPSFEKWVESTVRSDAMSGNPEPQRKALPQPSLSVENESGNPEPLDTIAALAIGQAKDKQAKRRQREDELRERREAKEAQAREQIAALESPYELVVSDLRSWRPEGVNSIITDSSLYASTAAHVNEQAEPVIALQPFVYFPASDVPELEALVAEELARREG